jgi:HAD superfamily hydrolase (TIGR01509 family)
MTPAVPPRAVVFDFDGTLIDSLPLVLAAITHALEPFGARPTMEIFARLGGPPERFLGTLLDDRQHVPAALSRMETYHRDNAHQIRPYAGVSVMLERLRARGTPCAVWTGRDRASTSWLLRQHGLEAYFATVVCGDDLPSHKPDPAGLREVMRRLAVTPGETLLVGDADVDVLGGVACGVDTLLIQHARRADGQILARAWRTVPTPADAFDLVLDWVENPAATPRPDRVN